MTSAPTRADALVATKNTKSQRVSSSAPAGIVKAVADASAKVGISFSYLMNKAEAESSYNPTAKAKTSSASGLYQFIDSTWLDMVNKYGAKHGLGQYADAIDKTASGKAVVTNAAMKKDILALKNDPKISALMAAEYAGENKTYLEKQLGRAVSDTDLYLAHFLGAGGACKFLKAMDKNGACTAASILPDAAAANKSVFYSKTSGNARTLDQIYAKFESKFNTDALTNTGIQLASADTGSSVGDIVSGAFGASDTTAQSTGLKTGTTPLPSGKDTRVAGLFFSSGAGAISSEAALHLASLDIIQDTSQRAIKALSYDAASKADTRLGGQVHTSA